MLLGVIVPVYNEERVLPRMIARLDATPRALLPDGTACTRQLFLVDDGSTDGSADLIADLGMREDVTPLYARSNGGKGTALARGFAAALQMGCDVVIVQDADMEYDPADHQAALNPIFKGQADAVIGTRFLGQTHRVLYFWHSLANRVITLMSNMLSNLNLTDIECGTKAFTAPVLEQLVITEPRFGVEPEIIAKLASMRIADSDHPGGRRPLRIYEVPISYAGRTYAEGKKIGWKDGVRAIYAIAKHNIFSPAPPAPTRAPAASSSSDA